MFIQDDNTPANDNEESHWTDSGDSSPKPAKRKSAKHKKQASKKPLHTSWQKIEPHLAEVQNLLAQGATIADVADFLGISYATFYEMRKEMPELEDVIDGARKKGTAELVSNIWKLAKGEAVRVEEIELRDDSGNITGFQKKITRLEPQLYAIIELLKLFNQTPNHSHPLSR